MSPTTTKRRASSFFSSSSSSSSRKTMLLPQYGSRNDDNGNDSTTNTADTEFQFEFALLFDCDGVILETEELHRQAYNAAFDEFGLYYYEDDEPAQRKQQPVQWSMDYYDVLQNSIGGGIPKMTYSFRERRKQDDDDGTTTMVEFPRVAGRSTPITSIEEQDALIQDIQRRKTEIYKSYIEQKAVPRPGVLRLMDEALAAPNIAVGVCSASTKEAALKVLQVTLGPERLEQLNVVLLGDDVAEKKPSPLIYTTARERLGIDDPLRCVVIEDSMVGLKAAKAAGMHCIVTYTASTTMEDFYGAGAQATVPNLDVGGGGDGGEVVTLSAIFDPLKQVLTAELLVGIKDNDPAAAISIKAE